MSAVSMRRGWCPGARRPMETGDGLLVRVHPPGGVLSAAQAQGLADTAEACGSGLLDVTARGNLQIRGVSETTHAAVLERLSAIGLLEGDGAGPYRLTLVSPLSGIDPAAAFDSAALAAEIEARIGDVAADLPAKFYVAVDDGGTLRLEPGADVWVAAAAGGVAIGLAAGDGYVWHGPVPLADAAGAVAGIVSAFAHDRGDARRMRDLAKPARETLTRKVAALAPGATLSPLPRGEGSGVWGVQDDGNADAAPYQPPRPSTPVEPGPTPHTPSPSPRGRGERVAGFIGACALLLALPFGRATAAQLRLAAGWAEAHGAGEVRLSVTRGILIPHLASGAAERIARAAENAGFVTNPADPRLALVACPGTPACARGNTAAPRDALALVNDMKPLAAAGARIHLSACPKGCAHPRAADLTLVGRPDGRYDVIPGGAAGDAPMIALPLHAIAAVLRRTSDPRGLAAAFGDHEP
ncbi:precorrin-3B synthase [Salinarimonas sp. NSM]|uniref:precorrin-3B synthase n=1 Tax=Salinarimonas sp. NSM TaxID=3458003 RepID=UPI00403723F5